MIRAGLQAEWKRRALPLRFLAKTSRGSFTDKDTWFVRVWHKDNPGVYGIGECAMFAGLSAEDDNAFETRLHSACLNIEHALEGHLDSSVRFGLESAMLDLQCGATGTLYGPTPWTERQEGITINGLIWMADVDTMRARVADKLALGFKCLKLKIGVDFESELNLIEQLRNSFNADVLELRVDANGAFTEEQAKRALEQLGRLDIHSIEQPIRQKQPEAMARLCRETPVPIALDEELIGVTPMVEKQQMLEFIRPQYIILKPSLCGGLAESEQWIEAAERHSIGWWATSALESPIGLNVLAQWAYKHSPSMPQGLGTGEVYDIQIPSQTELRGQQLWRSNQSRASWEQL